MSATEFVIYHRISININENHSFQFTQLPYLNRMRSISRSLMWFFFSNWKNVQKRILRFFCCCWKIIKMNWNFVLLYFCALFVSNDTTLLKILSNTRHLCNPRINGIWFKPFHIHFYADKILISCLQFKSIDRIQCITNIQKTTTTKKPKPIKNEWFSEATYAMHTLAVYVFQLIFILMWWQWKKEENYIKFTT